MILFFFYDTAPPEIYTLSLHDALPISRCADRKAGVGIARLVQPGELHHHDGAADRQRQSRHRRCRLGASRPRFLRRSEEHTSELQSHVNLVCRLLLEKKKKTQKYKSSK